MCSENKLEAPLELNPLEAVSIVPIVDTQQISGEPVKKLKAATKIKPDDTMAQAGRKVWLFQFDEMLRHEEGTRLGEDIEALHDMRVATRRMRAAFDIFDQAFKPKALRPHLEGLRATGRRLGRVRDLDVFIEKAERYLETLPEESGQGLNLLLETWKGQREEARAKMVAYLDSLRYQQFKERFFDFLTSPGRGEQPPPVGHPVPNRVFEVAPVLIYSRLAAVRAYGPWLDNASIEQLHGLRIEFKKLRYAVEFFRDVLGEEARDVINDLKLMQDHLGDLNDAQVATQLLGDFLASWDDKQKDLPINERQSPEALVAYLVDRHAERYRLLATFHETWGYFNRDEFRSNLARAISVL